MKWKPIDLDDRHIIEPYFQKLNFGMSDYSFTNLYLWHFSRQISYVILDGFLCIKVQYPSEYPFIFMPLKKGCKDESQAIIQISKYFSDNDFPFGIRALSKKRKDKLLDIMPNAWETEYIRDRSDYVYLIEDLICLKGRKYHTKKNHLNRFFNTYKYEYQPINKHNIPLLISTWKEWFGKISDNTIINLKYEYIGIIEVLKNFNHLNAIGAMILVDGAIVAFSIGEQLDERSIVIHIEKANTKFHGAYQAINNQFLLNEFSHFKYVNREEDLGIEGLRKAKLSYHPAFLLDKYNAYFKG